MHVIGIHRCLIYNNNNNNTGHLLHAISPKSKEHIAYYKHNYNKLEIHCCETLLQLQNIEKTLQKNTHSSNSTSDKGLRKTNNNGYIQAVSRQDGKGGFYFGI